MKILWVSHFLPYPATGHGALQRTRCLSTELAKKHDVYLLSYDKSVGFESKNHVKDAELELSQFFKYIKILPFRAKSIQNSSLLNKLFHISWCVFNQMPYSVHLYRSYDLCCEVLKIIKEFDIDLVHVDTLGLIDPVLNKITIKTVLNHHNIESEMMKRRAEKEKNIFLKSALNIEALLLKIYEKKHCGKYDLNIVVSDLDQSRLSKKNRTIKTAVVENPVDLDYYRFEKHDYMSDELIFAGSLDWYPNADAMILFCSEFWPYLKKYLPELKLTVIGKNPPLILEQLVEKMKDIKLAGFVKDVRIYINKAKVYVCPIMDGGGTRLKILDALAQGIPVVATGIAVEGIDLEDHKNIMIADTKEKFLEKIQMLFTNKELYAQISENGRKFVEKNYSSDHIGRRISRLYENI